jgi:histidinol-phosphatase (PHP family)
MIDCHIHTARCGHGEGGAADYLAAARRQGVDLLTFTEHLPLPKDLDPTHEYSMPESELTSYLTEIVELADLTCTEEEGVRVLVGIEADWLPDRLDHVRRLLAGDAYDVVLGSVHFLDDWAFDDPALLSRWDAADVDAIWERYFEELARAAASGLYDVMAHPDLVKKFGYRPSYDPRELYEAAALAFADAGVAVEVSTAGLRKPVAELYPGAEFLAACARAGVPATMGSDAHHPNEVGFGFDEALDALRTAGYDHLVYFERREIREYPL